MHPYHFSIPFEYNGRRYQCEIHPIRKYQRNPLTFQVTLNDVYFGIITYTGETWESDTRNIPLVNKIGSLIHESVTGSIL